MNAKLTVTAKFTAIITSWIRLHIDTNTDHQFPVDIIRLIVNEYLIKPLILRFSSKFKSGDVIKLSDDNKRAIRVESNLWHAHVLIDDDPVKSGVHVWRFKVKIIHAICCINACIEFKTQNR